MTNRVLFDRVSGTLRALGLVLAWMLLALPAFANQNDGSIPEAAKLHFQNGIELLQSDPPNYQDAYYQFKEAYRLSNSWKVLGNLGLCALKLERDGEALAYYKEYFARGDADIDPEERAAIERETLLIEGNMARVILTVDRPGVTVTDSRQGGRTPQVYELLPGRNELGLRSGSHQLVATSGDATRTWNVTLTPRKTFEHTFDFDAPEAPAPVSDPSAEPSTESKGSTVRTVGWVMAGVGVAALAGGAITGLLKNGAEEDARERLRRDATRCLGNVCSDDAKSEFDEAESLALTTNVLLIAGGVLAAGGVSLVILGAGKTEDERPASARLNLVPVASPALTGFVAEGRF